jgi:hypothetical protein
MLHACTVFVDVCVLALHVCGWQRLDERQVCERVRELDMWALRKDSASGLTPELLKTILVYTLTSEDMEVLELCLKRDGDPNMIVDADAVAQQQRPQQASHSQRKAKRVSGTSDRPSQGQGTAGDTLLHCWIVRTSESAQKAIGLLLQHGADMHKTNAVLYDCMVSSVCAWSSFVCCVCLDGA